MRLLTWHLRCEPWTCSDCVKVLCCQISYVMDREFIFYKLKLFSVFAISFFFCSSPHAFSFTNHYPIVSSDCWKTLRAGQSWANTFRWNGKDPDWQDQVHKARKVGWSWLCNEQTMRYYNEFEKSYLVLFSSGRTWPAGYQNWSRRTLTTTWTHRHQWAPKAWKITWVLTRKVSREVRYLHLPLGFGLKLTDKESKHYVKARTALCSWPCWLYFTKAYSYNTPLQLNKAQYHIAWHISCYLIKIML